MERQHSKLKSVRCFRSVQEARHGLCTSVCPHSLVVNPTRIWQGSVPEWKDTYSTYHLHQASQDLFLLPAPVPHSSHVELCPVNDLQDHLATTTGNAVVEQSSHTISLNKCFSQPLRFWCCDHKSRTTEKTLFRHMRYKGKIGHLEPPFTFGNAHVGTH